MIYSSAAFTLILSTRLTSLFPWSKKETTFTQGASFTSHTGFCFKAD